MTFYPSGLLRSQSVDLHDVMRAEVSRADERRHRLARGPWSGEAWGFDFADADSSLAGFVRIAVYPSRGVAWFWAALVGDGRAYVLCRDTELTPPADPSVLELRGVSLWTHAICETPLEHWTVAMEAYAVAFDDPVEAWRGERGDRVGLAFDLEWECPKSFPAWVGADDGSHRYEAACTVNGELLLGDESWTIAGVGARHHEWGRLDWSGPVASSGRRGSGDVVCSAPLLVDRPGGPAQLLRTLRRGVAAMVWSEELVDAHAPPNTVR